MRRLALVSLLALAACFAAHHALAATLVAPAAPRVPAVVKAGEWIELACEPAGAGVDEFEILLSLDDGRTYPWRVSPELETRTRTYRWRVPNLACAEARLAVRAGGELGETRGRPSRRFRIVPDPGAPRAEAGFHEGWYWTGVASLPTPPPAGLAPPRAELRDGADSEPPPLPTRIALAAPTSGARTSAPTPAPVTTRTTPPDPGTPRLTPLRL